MPIDRRLKLLNEDDIDELRGMEPFQPLKSQIEIDREQRCWPRGWLIGPMIIIEIVAIGWVLL